MFRLSHFHAGGHGFFGAARFNRIERPKRIDAAAQVTYDINVFWGACVSQWQ